MKHITWECNKLELIFEHPTEDENIDIYQGCTEKFFFDTYVLFSYFDPPRQGGRVPGTQPPPVDAIQTST